MFVSVWKLAKAAVKLAAVAYKHDCDIHDYVIPIKYPSISLPFHRLYTHISYTMYHNTLYVPLCCLLNFLCCMCYRIEDNM